MVTHKQARTSLLEQLQKDYVHLSFTKQDFFCWSPANSQIFYTEDVGSNLEAQYALFHELAHALLGHHRYASDYELIRYEVAAWEHAKHIADTYNLAIDDEHIQHCVDSYRDWLYKRSICPLCGVQCLQCDAPSSSHYQCFNCHRRWHVTGSRFCRPYRQQRYNEKPPAINLVADGF